MFSFFVPLTPAESPENAQLYKDSISDSVAPVEPDELVTNTGYRISKEEWESWGWAGDIEPPPEPTWECDMFGIGITYNLSSLNKVPNRFQRWMQLIFFGNRWRKL